MGKNSLSCDGGAACFFQKTGNGVARLRAFADPIIGAFQIDREIVALFERLIRSDFLDEFSITRTAAIGDNNAVHRRVLRADPFHANFY
jgi:hypothetical protein